MSKKFPEFSLKSKEEAGRFDALVMDWQRRRHGATIQYLPLEAVWDFAQKHPDGGRFFAAALDLKLNMAMLASHMNGITKVMNSDIHKGRKEADSILDDPEHFVERLDLLEAASSYILRYRAIWDKVLGFIVLLAAPGEYQRFVGASSRQADFRRIAGATKHLPKEFVDYVLAVINEFDSRYRTAEAHGSGRIRKFSLMVQLERYNPSEMLIWAWNDLNSVMQRLNLFFEGVARRG